MTQETIDLIIEWFGHIQQMATDRKTLTGAVMDAQHCLNEIAAIASDSKQFVEEYRDEQEPINEEELEKLADEESLWLADAPLQERRFKEGFKEGYRKAWNRNEYHLKLQRQSKKWVIHKYVGFGTTRMV